MGDSPMARVRGIFKQKKLLLLALLFALGVLLLLFSGAREEETGTVSSQNNFDEAAYTQMLEEKVNKHNNLIERTFVLEGQVSECRHDIKELKAYHRPIS